MVRRGRPRVADYSAAIAALARQKPHPRPRLRRRRPPGDSAQPLPPTSSAFTARRGNASVALKQWQQAVDRCSRVVTDETTDETLLSNQALANAGGNTRVKAMDRAQADRKQSRSWVARCPSFPDDSILASGENPAQDRYHVDLTLGARR